MMSMYDILIQKNCKRSGPVHRKGNKRLPKQIVYSKLCEGLRAIGQLIKAKI